MINILLMCIMFVLLVSCEQTVVNVELPYEEKFVVEAFITDGVPAEYVFITKSLPPLETWSFEKAEVKDAQVIIEFEGKDYVLEYQGNGQYANYELIGQQGKEYKLKIDHKGLKATATTIIPEGLDVDSVYVEVGNSQIRVEFTPHKNVYYMSGVIRQQSLEGNSFDESYDWLSEPYSWKRVNSKGKVVFYREIIRWGNMFANRYFIDAFDTPFDSFYRSRYSGESDGGLFGSIGTNVKGNIENGIGIFCGRNRTIIFER